MMSSWVLKCRFSSRYKEFRWCNKKSMLYVVWSGACCLLHVYLCELLSSFISLLWLVWFFFFFLIISFFFLKRTIAHIFFLYYYYSHYIHHWYHLNCSTVIWFGIVLSKKNQYLICRTSTSNRYHVTTKNSISGSLRLIFKSLNGND